MDDGPLTQGLVPEITVEHSPDEALGQPIHQFDYEFDGGYFELGDEEENQAQAASAPIKIKSLHDEIRDLFRCPDNDLKRIEFVPEKGLRELFVNHRGPGGKLEIHLENCLQNADNPSDSPGISHLVDFICDRAPKAFATLIYCKSEHRITNFFHGDLDDTLLPVEMEWNGGKARISSSPAESRRELAQLALRHKNEEASRINELLNRYQSSAKPDHKQLVKDLTARLEKKQKDIQKAETSLQEAETRSTAAARRIGNVFRRLSKEDREAFCDEYQWRFMAPVFSNPVDFRYRFAKDAVMPFWPSGVPDKEGNFSVVKKRRIHCDHLLPRYVQQTGQPGVNTQKHPWVAVKVLSRGQFNEKAFQEAVTLEAKVLEAMTTLNHPNFIQTIACYHRGAVDCFVFPWTDIGNLRDYWKSSDVTVDLRAKRHERMAPTYLRWLFTQLRGLAEALSWLHERIIRHGDLKPENILCFPNGGGGGGVVGGPASTSSSPASCILKIADAGLSKINYLATQLREMASIGPKGGTLLYEPPEAEVGSDAPSSRRYDVWSLGCVFLELLIWLVDGPGPEEGLRRFQDDLRQVGRFYQPLWSPEQGRAMGSGRQEQVVARIEKLRAHPVCQGTGNPLGGLVKLVDTGLLVHSLGINNRIQLSPSGPQVAGDGAAALAPAPMGYRAVTRADTGGAQFFMTPEEERDRSRIDSGMMLDELKSILAANETSFSLPYAAVMRQPDGQSPLTTTNIPPETSTRGEPDQRILEVPDAGEAETGRKPSSSLGARIRESISILGPLNDTWEYAPDTEFPVNEIDWRTDLQVPSTKASNLCSRCASLQLWATSCSFSDTLAGLTNKALTCALCRLLRKHTINRVEQDDQMIYFFRVRSYITFGDQRRQPILSLCTFPGMPSLAKHEIQTGLPKLPEAGSPTHIQILSKWISSCDTSHRCLPQNQDFVPTRLLDVGSVGFESIHLVENNPEENRPERYLALSHRWGSPELHQTFRTLRSNIARFKQHILLSDLPATFRDAVQVTRSLGVPYLWIDSLCIVQDDSSDWEAESKRMEQVFSSAYATISASCSSGTTDGFLKPRPARECVTAMLAPAAPVITHGGGGARYYVCDAIDDFGRDVDDGELSKRAWVLQERALSRRTIYFSQKQCYWECGRGVRCETLTKMTNNRASFLGDADFPHSVDAFVKGLKIELYQGLYERFSRLQITVPGDRPVAIRGLEARLMRTLGTAGGFGVFHIYLHRCLLWQRAADEPALRRIRDFHGGPTVPSWSWMAYEGAIGYLEVPYGSVVWEGDVVSPYGGATVAVAASTSGGGQGSTSSQEDVPKIGATAWDFASGAAILTAGDQQGILPRVILDELDADEARCFHRPLKCVVVGRSKRPTVAKEQANYVLIIGGPVIRDSRNGGWERIGLGVMRREDILWDGPKVRVLVQ